MSIDTRPCTRKSSQPIDSNAENELVCVCDSQTQVYSPTTFGLDHGVGHPLLLLYNAKAPNGQKSKEFNDLGHYLSKSLISLF